MHALQNDAILNSECKCCHELQSQDSFGLVKGKDQLFFFLLYSYPKNVRIKFVIFFVDSKCITQNENFQSIVLLKENLWAVLVVSTIKNVLGYQKIETVFQIHREVLSFLTILKSSNKNICMYFLICFTSFYRSYRFAAYRQFTWWVHNKGVKGFRHIIPSCAVSRIREEFPSDTGVYKGFVEGEQKNEIEIT